MNAADRKTPSRLLWGTLILTLAATAWVAASDEPSEPVAAPARKTARLAVATPPGEMPPEVPATYVRTPIEAAPEDLFGSAQPIPPEVEVPSAPAKPTMPAFPFAYAGKMIEEGRYTIFLTQGERNLAAHLGDVVDGVWRVQSIQPPTMRLLYLPLNTEVSIAIGETN